MSKKLDVPLSLGETVSLRFHTMMCKNCRRCESQLKKMHQITGQRHKA